MPEKVMLFFFCSRKTHYFIIYGHILLFMGMSRVGYWETYGRARPQHFQRDNKHILQKTEFVEAKFSRSGEKEKKKKKTKKTNNSANRLSFYELEGLLISRKECPCWAGPGDC